MENINKKEQQTNKYKEQIEIIKNINQKILGQKIKIKELENQIQQLKTLIEQNQKQLDET